MTAILARMAYLSLLLRETCRSSLLFLPSPNPSHHPMSLRCLTYLGLKYEPAQSFGHGLYRYLSSSISIHARVGLMDTKHKKG